MVMADKIVILNAGRIEQEGAPEDVYNNPVTPFVACFMGAENTIELPARLVAGRIDIPAGPHNGAATLRPRNPASNAVEWPRGATTVTAYFRSEVAELVEEEPHFDQNGQILLKGRITQVSYPGGTWRHTVQVGDQDFHVDSSIRHDASTPVLVRLPAEAVFLLRTEYKLGSGDHEERIEARRAEPSARANIAERKGGEI